MHWLLVFVVLFPGQPVKQIELNSVKKYESLAACNEDLALFSMVGGVSRPWAVTCIQGHIA